MAQKKTTKKATAKRTTAARTTKRNGTITGSTNLKTKPKWMNWKVIVPLILVVAAVGGYFFVWQSEAASKTHTIGAEKLREGRVSGGTLSSGNKRGVAYNLYLDHGWSSLAVANTTNKTAFNELAFFAYGNRGKQGRVCVNIRLHNVSTVPSTLKFSLLVSTLFRTTQAIEFTLTKNTANLSRHCTPWAVFSSTYQGGSRGGLQVFPHGIGTGAVSQKRFLVTSVQIEVR